MRRDAVGAQHAAPIHNPVGAQHAAPPGRGAALLAAVKRIVGMPNYDAYVAHLREKHPECAIPTEREYYKLYLDAKYNGGPGSRCC